MQNRSLLSDLFDRHGYVILPGIIPPDFIAKCRTIVEKAATGEWTWGSQGRHKWREMGRPQIVPVADVIDTASLKNLLGYKPRRQFQWINFFEPGQFVEAHKDAGGEAHLLVPLEIPPRQDGGQFWLKNKKNVVPVGVGDALLLKAHSMRHGTTLVRMGRRITFNIRFWSV